MPSYTVASLANYGSQGGASYPNSIAQVVSHHLNGPSLSNLNSTLLESGGGAGAGNFIDNSGSVSPPNNINTNAGSQLQHYARPQMQRKRSSMLSHYQNGGYNTASTNATAQNNIQSVQPDR